MTTVPYSNLTIENLADCGTTTPPPLYPTMVYGNTTGTICKVTGGTLGISFTAPASSSGGSYSYTQLVNSDSTTQPGAPSCTTNSGLDGNNPYGGTIANSSPLKAGDAPGIQLIASSASSLQRTFNATMFLMWTPNLANSIAVPMGYQNWGFSATANCSASCGTYTNWTVTLNGIPGASGTFVPSNGSQTSDGFTFLQFGYPIWSSVATRTCH